LASSIQNSRFIPWNWLFQLEDIGTTMPHQEQTECALAKEDHEMTMVVRRSAIWLVIIAVALASAYLGFQLSRIESSSSGGTRSAGIQLLKGGGGGGNGHPGGDHGGGTGGCTTGDCGGGDGGGTKPVPPHTCYNKTPPKGKNPHCP
jgi:hypothetical protein